VPEATDAKRRVCQECRGAYEEKPIFTHIKCSIKVSGIVRKSRIVRKSELRSENLKQFLLTMHSEVLLFW
jgi:hypothetical protein